MEIVITHPSLEDYQDRLNRMADKYSCESWMTLVTDSMSREDRFEYSFIVSAVGGQLMEREFANFFHPPSGPSIYSGVSNEPGIIPGSFILWGINNVERPPVCEAY